MPEKHEEKRRGVYRLAEEGNEIITAYDISSGIPFPPALPGSSLVAKRRLLNVEAEKAALLSHTRAAESRHIIASWNRRCDFARRKSTSLSVIFLRQLHFLEHLLLRRSIPLPRFPRCIFPRFSTSGDYRTADSRRDMIARGYSDGHVPFCTFDQLFMLRFDLAHRAKMLPVTRRSKVHISENKFRPLRFLFHFCSAIRRFESSLSLSE